MAKEGIRTIEKGTLAFFAGTFCSRITGVIRDISMAAFLGCSSSVAAFMVAYRFANLFRRLLGEGPMPSGFIPHFETVRKKNPQEGAVFFRDVIGSIGLVLFILLLVSELGLFLWMRFGGLSSDTKEILYLTGLMMPGVVFVCLYGLSSALLQCEKKFFLSSVAPVFFNLVWICGVFLGRGIKDPSESAFWLSVAVVFGFFVQWACLIPSMGRYFQGLLPSRALLSFKPFSTEVRGVIKPLGLSMIGVAAMQINSALDALFARAASLEGPAYLWYAIRIQQLPLALFGIALSSALLPSLSRALSLGDKGQFQSLLQFAVQRMFTIMIPCGVAVLCLASSGVTLLYGRGDFTLEASYQTIYCLWAYGLGLLPAVFVLLLAPAFYAQKDYHTPMKASLYSVATNICLNAYFVFVCNWGACSIALATSAASLINCVWLALALRTRKITYITKKTLSTVGKTALCAFSAGSVVLFVESVVWEQPVGALLWGTTFPVYPRIFSIQAMQFCSLIASFTITFFSLAQLVGLKDVFDFIGMRNTQEEVR